MAANHKTKLSLPQPAKHPAPSSTSTSQPSSPKSVHLSSPPSTMKPSDKLDGPLQPFIIPKGNVNKKPKLRTVSSSNDTVQTNIDECLDSTLDLFDTHLDFSLTFDEFKEFFESAKCCSDLEKLCTNYNSSPDNILEIISTIYPNVTVKSAKNRLTRISNALKKIVSLSDSQNANSNCDDDETF